MCSGLATACTTAAPFLRSLRGGIRYGTLQLSLNRETERQTETETETETETGRQADR